MISGFGKSIFAAFLWSLIFLPIAEDVAAHSTGPVTIYPQGYSIQPGQTLTQDMRICLSTGGAFTVSNITFTGNYSDWATVNEQFPVRAEGATSGASGMDVPVTVTVPADFSEPHAIIQTAVEVRNADDTISAIAGIPVFIRENTNSHQNLTDCNFISDVRASISYGIIISIFVGAALVAIGYYVFRRSRNKSRDLKASVSAKVLLVMFVMIGSLLMLAGLFLLIFQGISFS